jgi:parvulin-like peptidyl-prolyl isomerase
MGAISAPVHSAFGVHLILRTETVHIPDAPEPAEVALSEPDEEDGEAAEAEAVAAKSEEQLTDAEVNQAEIDAAMHE